MNHFFSVKYTLTWTFVNKNLLQIVLSIQLTRDVVHQVFVTDQKTDFWTNVLPQSIVTFKTILEISNVFMTQFVRKILIKILRNVKLKIHVDNSLACVRLFVILRNQLLLVFLSYVQELDLLQIHSVPRLRNVNMYLLVIIKFGWVRIQLKDRLVVLKEFVVIIVENLLRNRENWIRDVMYHLKINVNMLTNWLNNRFIWELHLFHLVLIF